jgi:hypothetical protein
MRQSRLSGSVEGVMGNHDSYSDAIAPRAIHRHLASGAAGAKGAGWNHGAGLLATTATGVTNFNWSSSVNMFCHLLWSFFVSIGAERSE